MRIEIAQNATLEIYETFVRLMPQLSSSSPAPSLEDLDKLISSPASILFLARADDGLIFGSLTLVLFHTPTGLHGQIEDVVVDEAMRGQGAGEALVRAALAHAKTQGARAVDLTSRPVREAANRLYRRVGFVQRETNLYRYKL